MLAAGRFLPLRRTARLMHSRHFANLPDMNGMALGFYEETTNGHRIIGHAGDAQLVSGRYIISRRSETTILKVLTLLGESKVFTNADATISLDDLKDPNGQPKNSPGPAVPIGTR